MSTEPTGFKSLCKNLVLACVAPAFRRACAWIYGIGLKADATNRFAHELSRRLFKPVRAAAS